MAEQNDNERDDDESPDSETEGDETESESDSADAASTPGAERSESSSASEDDSDDSDESSVDAGSDDGGSDEPTDEDLERRALREAEAERKQLEREAEAMESDGTMAALLGPERWVQFAFIAMGVSVFFITDRLTALIWGYWAEPDVAVVSAVAGALTKYGTFALYRHPAVNKLADEVVTELSKVTWPTRDEVWVSTIVVVGTSVIAAIYTGLFDAMWSALTNIVYG